MATFKKGDPVTINRGCWGRMDHGVVTKSEEDCLVINIEGDKGLYTVCGVSDNVVHRGTYEAMMAEANPPPVKGPVDAHLEARQPWEGDPRTTHLWKHAGIDAQLKSSQAVRDQEAKMRHSQLRALPPKEELQFDNRHWTKRVVEACPGDKVFVKYWSNGELNEVDGVLDCLCITLDIKVEGKMLYINWPSVEEFCVQDIGDDENRKPFRIGDILTTGVVVEQVRGSSWRTPIRAAQLKTGRGELLTRVDPADVRDDVQRPVDANIMVMMGDVHNAYVCNGWVSPILMGYNNRNQPTLILLDKDFEAHHITEHHLAAYKAKFVDADGEPLDVSFADVVKAMTVDA